MAKFCRSPDRLKILISAGPTREYFDPVRFISNSSTGVMGFSLAEAACERRHRVILVSGPTSLSPPTGVKFIPVVSAREMQRALKEYFSGCDCLIMSAAVSDWHPASFAKKKIKTSRSTISLKLLQNPDIIKGLARGKTRQIVVGFALETENLIRNARQKLREKSLDLIVANQIRKGKSPFGENKTSVVIISREGDLMRKEDISKKNLARHLIRKIEKRGKGGRRDTFIPLCL